MLMVLSSSKKVWLLHHAHGKEQHVQHAHSTSLQSVPSELTACSLHSFSGMDPFSKFPSVWKVTTSTAAGLDNNLTRQYKACSTLTQVGKFPVLIWNRSG